MKRRTNTIIDDTQTYPAKRKFENMDTLSLMQAILGALPQSMLLLDKDKYIIGIHNPEATTLSRHSVQDIVGNHISVYANDPSSPFYQACSLLDKYFDPVFETGISERFEYMIDDTYLEATITKIMGDKILCQIRDISNIVTNRMEIERKGRNETYVALMAGGSMPWSYDIEKQLFTYSNNTGQITSTETSLQQLTEQIVPAHREIFLRMLDDLQSKRVTHSSITIKLNRDGKIQWVNIHAIPHIYSSEGEVKIIIGSRKDITQEYDINTEMENNRLKLKIAIDTGGMVLWEYNVASDLLKIYTIDAERADMVSFSNDFKSFIHPDDIGLFESETEALLEGRIQKFNMELRYAIEGIWKWLEINASIFNHSDDGTIVIGLTKNITEEVERKNELIELRDKAEEANRMKTAFVANMSHEIRTPLNAIIGFSSMAGSSENEDERKMYLSLVQENNEILLNLINDILDLSGIESGKITFRFSKIDVNGFLEQIASGIRLKTYKNVEVVCDRTSDKLEIVSDSNRLSQVLMNLMTNAAKFTKKGEIRVGCDTMSDGGVRFYVRDTGIGIPENKLSAVFGRFVKLDIYTQGTGLGLSICQTIVEMLGGRIGVNSKQGQGAEFWFTIPKQ